MSNINFEKISPSHAKLTLTISKEEIENKLKSELTKAQKTANLRGFRKGKVPMATMYKLFGNQTLMNYLDNEVDSSLKSYIEDNEIQTLFFPFPAEDHEPEAIDTKTIKDLSLRYELVLQPKVEVEVPQQPFERYAVIPEASLIDEQIERLRKESGKTEELTEGEIQDNDIIEVTFTEMKDGAAVAEGVVNDCSISLKALQETLRTELEGKPVGYTTMVDIFEVEKDSTEKVVRNYLLEVEEATVFEPTFELKVVGIKRLTPGQLDEEFFRAYDPSGEIDSEEKLRAFLIDDFKAHFDKEGLGMLKVRVQDEIVKQAEVPLDEALLRRVYDGKPENFEQFLKSLRWVVIRNNFMMANEIVPQESDLLEATRKRLARILGGSIPPWMDENVVKNFMERIVADEKQRDELFEEVIGELVLDRMATQAKVEIKEVDVDSFNAAIKAFNEEFASKTADEEE